MNKFLAFVLIILCSCSHNYKGEKPDFTKTGIAKDQEIEKFTIRHLHHKLISIKGDTAFNNTKTESFRPIINEVSPETDKRLTKLELQNKIQLGLLGGLIGLLVLNLNDPHNGALTTAFWGTWLASLGHSFWLSGKYTDARDQYNKDLIKKFTPTVGWTTSF